MIENSVLPSAVKEQGKMRVVSFVSTRNISTLCRYLILLCVFWSTLTTATIKQNTVEQYLSEASKAGLTPNRLIKQSSPYLLQHAYNPVHWYAWGEAAFKKAREENKPIFLSIGYSTCHWCHVMEHESFENNRVAEILNKNFVSIKVDREERPDVDKVYMAATQLINGSGGWPMTVFVNNKLEPFHAGTYYPRENIDGHRGLIDLLQTISQLWKTDRERVDSIAASISERIQASEKTHQTGEEFDADINALMFRQIASSFDTEYGGFGNAPKFPRPGIFSYLMSVIKKDTSDKFDKKEEAILILQKTLNEMAYGGIYDQIGGGFHRYSVDDSWQVPHFEKMLYSQALMTSIYVDMYQQTHSVLYKKVIADTLAFVSKEMTNAQGGFYSALDADSVDPVKHKGVLSHKSEGAYYLWLASDLKKILSKDEWVFLKTYFNIQAEGNIDSDPRNEFGNKNIFYVSEEYKNITLTKQQSALLKSAFVKLNKVRLTRPRPHLDDKIITAWNGMMISAYAKAYQVLKNPAYLKSAITAAKYIQSNLLNNKTLTLKRSIRANRVSVDSGLSDYVWYIRGLINLYHASDDKHWLALASKLQTKTNTLFYDVSSAGYFDFRDAGNAILFRSKNVYDGALPAVNAIAIKNVIELAQLQKNNDWAKKSQQSLDYFASVANSNPAACASLLAVKNNEGLQ